VVAEPPAATTIVRAPSATGRSDQLSRAGRRGRLGIELRGREQLQPGCTRNLDDRKRPLISEADRGIERPSERVVSRSVKTLASHRSEQDVHRPVSAVCDRADVDVSAGAQSACDRERNRPGGM
jgi:hypothetical protein